MALNQSQQIGLAGVRAEAAERVDFRRHRDLLAVDAHDLCAIDQPASERLAALVADDQHVGLRLPEVLP